MRVHVCVHETVCLCISDSLTNSERHKIQEGEKQRREGKGGKDNGEKAE